MCHLRMRAVRVLLMFSSLARSNRIGAFCSKNIPRHNKQSNAKLSMSTAQVDLERLAGDTVGGSGATLVPKVRRCVCECTVSRPVCCLPGESDTSPKTPLVDSAGDLCSRLHTAVFGVLYVTSLPRCDLPAVSVFVSGSGYAKLAYKLGWK